MYLTTRRDDATLEVELAGSWRGADLPAIDTELAGLSLAGLQALHVIVPEAVELDLAGAWRLREWLETAKSAGLHVEFVGREPGQVNLIDETLAGTARGVPLTSSESEFAPVSALGRQVAR